MDGDIILYEHELCDATLVPEALTALRRAAPDAVNLTPTGEPDRYTLRAGSKVGFVALPKGRKLVIRPKIPVTTLFALMDAVYEPGREPFQGESHSYTTVTEFFEFIVHAFVKEVEILVSRGLLCGYRSTTEDLPEVRGRLRLAETLTRHPALRDRHVCTFNRFTIDVPENRVLRSTIFGLESYRYRDATMRGRLYRLSQSLGEVKGVPDARWLVGQLGFHRLNDSYRPALSLARLLLDSLTFSGTEGEASFFAYVVDMDRLFEDYLAAVLERELGKKSFYLRRHEPHSLGDGAAGHVFIKPDLVLYRQGQPALVIDARYRLDSDQGDFYQLLAGCHALDLPVGVLVHPGHEKAPSGDLTVRGAGALRLHYEKLDLMGDPAQLESQGRELAGRIAALA